MIITESFVWINYPKSGSTFVRKALRQLYQTRRRDVRKRFRMRKRSMQEIACPNLRHGRAEERRGKPTPHGVVSQIPLDFTHLPVVSSIRNPFDTMVSLFTYADWKREDVWPAPKEVIRKDFASFPDLDFAQYLRYTCHFKKNTFVKISGKERAIGPLSKNFLMFFSKQPIAPEEIPVYGSVDDLRMSIAPVRFLRTERLSHELTDLLQACGFAGSDIRFIREMERENTSKRDPIESYYTPELRKTFLSREWLLFTLYDDLLGAGENSVTL